MNVAGASVGRSASSVSVPQGANTELAVKVQKLQIHLKLRTAVERLSSIDLSQAAQEYVSEVERGLQKLSELEG